MNKNYLQWICPNCQEINSDKKYPVICGACGKRFNSKELKKVVVTSNLFVNRFENK